MFERGDIRSPGDGSEAEIIIDLLHNINPASTSMNPIKRALVLGDNRLATSIIAGLSNINLDIHQTSHVQSALESTSSLTVHKIDNDMEALRSLLIAITPDVVFSTRSGSFDHQKEIIDCLIEVNIPRFVPCEWGQDSLNEKVQERLPPYKQRAQTIAYLRQQAEKKALSWVVVATGCSLEQSLISGNIGFDIEWQSATVHGNGEEKFAASSTLWPGRVASAIVKNWNLLENQYLYASGMVTSANSILEVLRAQTGQEWAAGCVDVEDTIHEAERRLERGFPDASMFLMERSVLFDDKLAAVRPFLHQDARGKLGLDEESLEPLVKRVLHDFKHHGKGGCGCD